MEADDLRQRLVAAAGDGPAWEVRVHRYASSIAGAHGFFVFFDGAAIGLTEARRIVDELSEGVSVILHDRSSDG
jgi:hypothetical protein